MTIKKKKKTKSKEEDYLCSHHEIGAKAAAKEYSKAIKEFGLDKIEDGWGQDVKRYMIDAFFAGFYAGRDYLLERVEKAIY